MDLRKIDWEVVDWMHLGPLAGCCEHRNEPSVSIKGLQIFDSIFK
jgi:hypothetical protein